MPDQLPFSWTRDADEHRVVFEEAISVLEQHTREAAALLVERLHAGGTVFTFGNGGSAAQAAHFAAELVGRFQRSRRALPAVAIGVDGAALTCIGNDFGFDELFARSIAALAGPGDVCVGLTTSGRSANVARGLAEAARKRSTTIALTGKGGLDGAAVDHLLAVPSSSTARVQEIHLFLIHAWCACIDEALGSESAEYDPT